MIVQAAFRHSQVPSLNSESKPCGRHRRERRQMRSAQVAVPGGFRVF